MLKMTCECLQLCLPQVNSGTVLSFREPEHRGIVSKPELFQLNRCFVFGPLSFGLLMSFRLKTAHHRIIKGIDS
jgi:hypothetical protein